MKFATTVGQIGAGPCRTPHGVRGLKYILETDNNYPSNVAPRTGCVD